MKKTVFISYHFRDKSFKGELQKWLAEAGVSVISVDEKDLRPEGNKEIESRIKEQICSSNLVFILVGNDTHNRPWVNYEVAVARSKGISTYWIRLPNRTGAAPLEVRGLACMNFEKNEIIKVTEY